MDEKITGTYIRLAISLKYFLFISY